MLIGARNESFVGFERAMLYMVDVVVLMKLYFEPSHVRLTQPQPLPHSIFDLDQALIRIIETAYLVKTARRQSLDAHRIYWRYWIPPPICWLGALARKGHTRNHFLHITHPLKMASATANVLGAYLIETFLALMLVYSSLS